MWFRTLTALAVLAILACSSAVAQVFPPAVQTPWNRYLATRIPDAYVPIIGKPGTTLIANSSTATSTQVFNLSLPFNFNFINTNYTAGFVMKVGANGYISFGLSSASGVPDLSTAGATQCIMPYWSDVQPLNTPEGGIYWRVDGVTPNRILTVEWRVQGVNAPVRNPGQFQAKLYEGSNKIEFFYSGNSVDRSTNYPTTGAAIGLKNSGFPASPFPASGNDAEKFLITLDPTAVPDTIALTRTRHGLVNVLWPWGGVWFQTQTPETYANWPNDIGLAGVVSPYFHYSFPRSGGQRIGFRFTAVDNDVAPDSAIYSPDRPGNVYPKNSTFQISGRFRNLGANSRTNVPVFADVYRGNTLLASFTGTAFPAPTAQNGTSTVTFGIINSGITARSGKFTLRIYSNLSSPVDQDRTNDTLYSTFYVSHDNDCRAFGVIQPTTFTPQLPSVYPVGVPMVPEIRFQNIGTFPQTNVPVGFQIYNSSCIPIYTGTGTVRGAWNTLEFRDVVFDGGFTPTEPGDYYIKVFSNLANDDDRLNDTLQPWPSCGTPFTVRYEIELEARPAGLTPGVLPDINGDYPDARPINLRVAFRNNGIIDATNVPARIEIRKGGCDTIRDPVVFRRSMIVTTVPGEASGNGTTVYADAGVFVPQNGPGIYCISVTITDPQDPLATNNTTQWIFTVKPRLVGTIYVGVGERYRTIQEANDSLYRYGVGGNVDFKLVDDQYIVRPNNNDITLPALDGRGDVLGAGPNARITWMPVAGKTNVDVILKSPSGIGIIYGQRDTLNPTGYQTWDGGPNRIMRFLMDTAGPVAPTKAIPFFLSIGASNFTIKNVRIEPRSLSLGLKASALTLPLVTYNRSDNKFTYDRDDAPALALSSAILVRNTPPFDAAGNNPFIGPRTRDTLRNQNNSFDNNIIRNFAFGITSVGAGPLYRNGDAAFVEYSNQNNSYANNTIEDVTRAGIALVFEKNSAVTNNTIRRVVNTTSVQHAVGVWLSAGGRTGVDTLKNRGYSDNIRVDRNRIYGVNASQGNGVAIWAETVENVFTTLSRVYRFPANGASNYSIWNNMAWNYAGQTGGAGTGRTAGVGLTMNGDTRIDFVTTGNRVENNTFYNLIAGTAAEFGVVAQRAQGSIRNNIFGLVSLTTNPIAVGLAGPDLMTKVNLDYNLYWVPNGSVGAMSNLSTNGFNIPSPPVGRTLNQWRALSGLDAYSLEGNFLGEFVSTTPGAEDLHMKNNITGSWANNRGVNIAGLTTDVDGDPRGSAGVLGRYDIGADEFNGVIRNNDVLAEDILAPFGYRAPTGQYSDAEYMMIDQSVPVSGRFRNMGGLPQTANVVNLTVDYWNGVSWSSTGTTLQQTAAFNVAEAKTVNFGTFTPRTLLQYGVNDGFYGLNPNVTPIYRFRITSGTDDFAGNNTYEKLVRFYVRRSDRYAIVSVEGRQVAMPADPFGKANKLNTDTLLAALDSINWERADGTQLEDFDLFDRDKWPKEDLNFKPWRIVIWAQGAEVQGMEPEERAALKVMLDSRDMYNRSNLIIAGQDIARIHDVPLTISNGQVADQDFVRNYLRAEYRALTAPTPYSNRAIKGVGINAGKFEQIMPTGVAGDNAPAPQVVRPTTGDGIARATHYYYQQTFGSYTDSASGVVTAATKRNVVYYAQDWRHYGRFNFEADRSGAQRLLLSGLDFVKHYEGVVPVKVASFDAYQSGKSAVKVDWTTSEEVDVAALEIERTEIERTPQGVREGLYTVIERKTPAGSATKGAKYSIVDANVQGGVEYRYRLVSVGVDGSRTVDAYDEVKVTGATEAAGFTLKIQPNPVRSTARVELRLPEAMKGRVELYSADGRLVEVLATGELSASTSLELNVEGLASGQYTIRVATAAGTELTQKLTVTK